MGILSNLLGGDVLDGVDKVASRFIESPSEANAHELKKRALDMQIALKQVDLNAVEAKHRSRWVAGWRPFIGWVCGSALAWTFIVQPLLVYLLAVFSPETPAPPGVDLAGLYPVLLGMLGLGGLRTYEKKQGVAK